MANRNLAGRCGIYCGSCGLYRAYKDNGEYLRRVSDEWKIPIEKIHCQGCHALTPTCAGSECKIVRCLNIKRFDYCFECSEYNDHSCGKHRELAERWALDKVDLRANLERIESGNLEAWLSQCDKAFRCQKCGKPLPVAGWNVLKKCYHCGSDMPNK